MTNNKILRFNLEIEKRWGEDVFVIDLGDAEVLCEKNCITNALYVYHPEQPVYSIIPNWEWTRENVIRLYHILHAWRLL